MLLLHNEVRPYAWGSTDGIAALTGSAPSGGPEAELWVGTHPGGPSIVVGDPQERTLAEVVAQDPARWLGADLAADGHTALPFLLKILAIGSPLSLQAHPSVEQARTGFAREEAAGPALDDPSRTYRDDQAKPEVLVALESTWALCGFRPPIEAANLLDGLGIKSLDPLVHVLASDPDGLRTTLSWLLRLEGTARRDVSIEIASSVRRVRDGDESDPRVWVQRLTRAFPGDPTALAPLLLRLLRLEPGEAAHLPAGNLHAYLSGSGVEVMAASDNVLRGGLTPKHIDVDELLDVLRFDGESQSAPAAEADGNGVTRYDAGEHAFALAAIDPGDGQVEVAPVRPSLLLATQGPISVSNASEHHELDGARAIFVPPGDGPLTVTGSGRLWWATTGDGLLADGP